MALCVVGTADDAEAFRSKPNTGGFFIAAEADDAEASGFEATDGIFVAMANDPTVDDATVDDATDDDPDATTVDDLADAVAYSSLIC